MRKLSDTKANLASVSKTVAFLAVFGITGIVAVTTYRYLMNQLNFDIDWDDVWKDL